MGKPIKPNLVPKMDMLAAESFGDYYGDDEDISLQELLNIFKDQDLNKVILSGRFEIFRPETDEEFYIRENEYKIDLAEYKKKLKEYNKRMKERKDDPLAQNIRKNGWMLSELDRLD